MITVHKNNERGYANHGWLEACHSFSFGDFYDPKRMGFGPLRVINEDRIAAGQGFPTHGHKDMEIITYVIEGAIAHKDTLGNGETLRPGEIQRMSAGTGIRHSEFNPLDDQQTHLLQIWILPAKDNQTPSYQQLGIAPKIADGSLTLIGSQQATPSDPHTVKIHQDVDLYAAKPKAGDTISISADTQRLYWLQVVKGDIALNSITASAGDAFAIEDETILDITTLSDSEFLLFDMARSSTKHQ